MEIKKILRESLLEGYNVSVPDLGHLPSAAGKSLLLVKQAMTAIKSYELITVVIAALFYMSNIKEFKQHKFAHIVDHIQGCIEDESIRRDVPKLRTCAITKLNSPQPQH